MEISRYIEESNVDKYMTLIFTVEDNDVLISVGQNYITNYFFCLFVTYEFTFKKSFSWF